MDTVTPQLISVQLVIAYLLPMLLLGLLLGRSQLHQPGKALLLGGFALLYVLHYQGITHLSGWPSRQDLPDTFDLIAHQVVQPDTRGNSDGHITLWVRTPGWTDSRLYRLPYSRELHERLAGAQVRIAQGKAQQGVRERSGNTQDGPRDRRGSDVHFRDRPRRELPGKVEN